VKVRLTRRALEQLIEILNVVRAENPAAADKVRAQFEKVLGRLSRFPASGRLTSMPGVRLTPTGRYPYLIFYRVVDAAEEVHVLRIRHGMRNPSRHLE
jgi:plasmid stabilization system protein ParE